jgi:hypothetical protein
VNTNLAYWRSVEREALEELDAARKLCEVRLVATRLVRAREMVKRLEGPQSAVSDECGKD